MNIQDFKKINAIAYDQNLREKLNILHRMLGVEITNIALQAIDYGRNFTPEAKNVLKIMSELAADVSIKLLEAKSNKKTLSPEEKADFESIKALAENLGNLQFKLNRIIQKSTYLQKLLEEIKNEGIEFAGEIMSIQKNFRNVRANINDFAFMSKDPDIAYHYSKELEVERK